MPNFENDRSEAVKKKYAFLQTNIAKAPQTRPRPKREAVSQHPIV